MYAEGIAVVSIVLFIVSWFVGFSAGIYLFYLFSKVHKHWAPGKSWGAFIPFSLFLPSFFTEKGNTYRVRLLKVIVVFILALLCGFGSAIWNESLRPVQLIEQTK